MSDVVGSEKSSRAVVLLRAMERVLNSDYCPQLNRFVYWMKEPFWCLVMALLLSLVAGLLLNPMALLLTLVLLLAGVVGGLFPRLSLSGLQCELTFDQQRGRVGQPLLVRLKIVNRRPWPAWGLSLTRGFAADCWQDVESRAGAEQEEFSGVSLGRIPALSQVEFSWPFVPVQHGVWPLMAPELETGFPFGLFRARRSVICRGTAIVWPAEGDLRGVPEVVSRETHDDSVSSQRPGDAGDLLGTRPFRRGDSLRRVHWIQTARQQQLIALERQSQARSRVVLQLDTSLSSHVQSVGADEAGGCNRSLLLAGMVAGQVCESLHRQDCELEVRVGTQVLSSGGTVVGFRRQMDAISAARLSPDGPGGPGAGLRASGCAGDEVILVTTARAIQQSPQLVWRHRVICVDDSAAGRVAAAGVWIGVAGRGGVERDLPRQWREVCHGG
ncbi:MAG: hypothetical protein RIT02_1154 [Planctomycetota bacterium]